MNLVNQEAPLEGLEIMVNELGSLVSDILESLADGAQFYMQEFLTDDDALEPAEEIDAPDIRVAVDKITAAIGCRFHRIG